MLWDELNADEFNRAVKETKKCCVLPFGVIEKHGTHLPFGTDMLIARHLAIEAAKIEPVVVFPYYCFGQIAEARHVPGTISVSPELQYSLLDEVCGEICRNGFNKIVILNSHGGNSAFVKNFLLSRLSQEREYNLYAIRPLIDHLAKIKEVLGTEYLGEHGGNKETACIMAIRPDLVDMDNVDDESLDVVRKLEYLSSKNVRTPVNWYSAHPTHFAGNPYSATEESGNELVKSLIGRVTEQLKAIKEDTISVELQNEFFGR